MRVSHSNRSFPGKYIKVISTEASVQAFVEVPKAFVDVTSTEAFVEAFEEYFVHASFHEKFPGSWTLLS